MTQNPRNGPGPTDIETYFIGSCTSFSAPQVCGIGALLFQADPRASAELIESTLERTALRYRNGAAYVRVGGLLLTSFDKGARSADAYTAALALASAAAPDTEMSTRLRGTPRTSPQAVDGRAARRVLEEL